MKIRTARFADIKQIQNVRNSVTENTLSNPNLVTDKDCEDFLFERGKGWVCEIQNQILGFAIVDLQDENVWALFVHPAFERRRIGRGLHDTMLNWYFTQTANSIWLATHEKTRAEAFYRKSAWTEVGAYGIEEVKFEMTFETWHQLKHKKEPEQMVLYNRRHNI